MDGEVLSATAEPNTTGDCDEVLLLKKKLSETEEKLVKFKKFVVNLRNERSELQNKIAENDQEIERLKSLNDKFQNKKIFQNYQSLQNSYDKIQDEVEDYKKTKKQIENDLLKCSDELSQYRQTCETQKDEIQSLKNQLTAQQQQWNSAQDEIKGLESKVIVLETEYKNEKKKTSNFQQCESENNEIKEELSAKCNEIQELTKKLADYAGQISDFETKLKSRDTLIEQLQRFEQECKQLEEKCQENGQTIESKNCEIELLKQNTDELTEKNETVEKNLKEFQFTSSQKVSTLELKVSDLESRLHSREEDLRTNIVKFEEYKTKVANVLKENRSNSFEFDKKIELLNLKISSLEEENKTLENNHQSTNAEAVKLRELNSKLKIDYDLLQSQLDNQRDYKQKIDLLLEENTKLNGTLKQLQVSFAKEKQEINEQHLGEIDSLKEKYENKIKILEDEIVNIQNSSDDLNVSVVNSNTSFEEIKEENMSTQSTNSSFEKNFLEEILNAEQHSTTSPDVIPTNDSNINNLTHLLAESENSISLLSEQNRVLKEEIRRLHRSIERVDIANNMEYLKNILLKFMSIKGVEEKEHLITVLTTILKLTSEERQVFHMNASGQSVLPSTSWKLW